MIQKGSLLNGREPRYGDSEMADFQRSFETEGLRAFTTSRLKLRGRSLARFDVSYGIRFYSASALRMMS